MIKMTEIPTIINYCRFNPTSGLHLRDADIVRREREERDTLTVEGYLEGVCLSRLRAL